MDRLKHIVVGVDFSNFSEAALQQAIRIARRNQANLHVLHVVHHMVVSDFKEILPGDTDQLHEEIRAAATERLDQLVRKVGCEGIELTIEVAIGTPVIDLLRRTRDQQADLLVLGVKGKTDRSIGAGTLATKCVREAAVRVMLVHPDHAERFERVVACVDFSHNTPRVLEQAVRVCQQDAAKLYVIHAYYPPWKVLHYMAPTRQAAPEYQQQYQQLLTDRLRSQLKPFETDTAEFEVECQLVECPEPAEGIVEFQNSIAAGLIVLGTQGVAGLRALIMGTTAEKILQETKCSILAVKPEGFTWHVD